MEISKKLMDSINKRVGEATSGRIIIPTDIKKRVMAETGNFDEYDVSEFICNIYNCGSNQLINYIILLDKEEWEKENPWGF